MKTKPSKYHIVMLSNDPFYIQNLSTSKILTKEDWYDFKEKFSNVYPLFFWNIKEKGFQLTKSEQRLVALEKLGMDSTEIAKMLGISSGSVIVSRYRLRKKMNAPNDVPIVEYLEAS